MIHHDMRFVKLLSDKCLYFVLLLILKGVWVLGSEQEEAV